VEDRRGTYTVVWGDLRERDHLQDLGIDWRKILKWIYVSWMRNHGLDCCGSG